MSGAPRAQEWIDQCETLVSRRGHRIAFRRRGEGPTVVRGSRLSDTEFDDLGTASRDRAVTSSRTY